MRRNQAFRIEKRHYATWGVFEVNAEGQEVWLCREYHGDGSLYATAAEIEQHLENYPARVWDLMFSEEDESW